MPPPRPRIPVVTLSGATRSTTRLIGHQCSVSGVYGPNDLARGFAAIALTSQRAGAVRRAARLGPQQQQQQHRQMATENGKSMDADPEADASKTGEERPVAGGPTSDQLPSASEEAAAIGRIIGGDQKFVKAQVPELEQGTPVEEMIKRDEDALKYAPQVVRDQIKGSRSFSTSARQYNVETNSSGTPEDGQLDPSLLEVVSALKGDPDAPKLEGLKFEMPEMPTGRSAHLRRRYDTVLEQFTKLLMRDGKLARAQKNMNIILDTLRSAPPPKLDPERPLLGGPAPAQLPLDPVAYLTAVVDSVAPLLRIRQQKGAAGGGMSLPIPHPLGTRQRRRLAIRWIIDASDKRRDIALARRVAQEIVAVAEGRSSVWEKRHQLHKLGVSARANIAIVNRR